MGFRSLAPSVYFLLGGVLIDAILGDPQVRFHPIRLIGATLSAAERLLRRLRLDGRFGGCVLFVFLSLTWVAVPCIIVTLLDRRSSNAAAIAHILIVYICFALRDLLDHVGSVRYAANLDDVDAARSAIQMLVGRDIDKMDVMACRRAAIESLSENFVDGVLSPVFWYVLFGLPGLLLFKVVSTMDSMVGYKTPQYFLFGWCGARLDDLMNYIPARLAWLLVGLFAIPKAWRIGLAQHGILPGPNPGWSEATMAGALSRKLIGPIWKNGAIVTATWIGDPNDEEAGTDEDLTKAMRIVISVACITLLLGVISIYRIWG